MRKLLQEMEEYAAKYNVPIINSNGRAVLLDIIKQRKANAVLEIGTAIGYSTLLLAEHSAADVKITTLELDKERAAIADSFIARSPFAAQIEIIVGDAAEQLLKLTGKYDFVFIDAAKGQYPRYFRSILPLLAKDSVIVADNVLFRGLVRSAEPVPHRYRTIVNRLREYIDITMNHPDFVTKIYENGDGLAVSQRKGEVL